MRDCVNALALPFFGWLDRREKRRLMMAHIEEIRADIETYRQYGKLHLIKCCEGEILELEGLIKQEGV